MFVLEGWFTQTTEIIFSHLYLVVSSHAHRFGFTCPGFLPRFLAWNYNLDKLIFNIISSRSPTYLFTGD